MKKMHLQHYEGAIAKKKNSKYLSKRSTDWLKLKDQNRQELVIGGYTDPKGSRKGFGALLIGVYSGEKLIYAGRVGTGFSDKELTELHNKLSKIERKGCPFNENSPETDKDIHWITPKYVAEIEFTEWTSKNKLRHPSYVGLRVVKEE